MIDFRYHLVSIVAVFLALAVGIVLGSTELRGTAFTALDKASSELSAKLSAANSENSQLQQELAGDNGFAKAAEPTLLSHLLDGKRVVLVTEPGASTGVVNGMTTALHDAGATVTGQLSLQPKFFDSSAATLSVLDQLTQRLTPPGSTLTNGTPWQQAGELLADAVLSTSAAPGDHVSSSAAGSGAASAGGQASDNAQTILSGYGAGGFLTVSGQPTSGATLAVVVTTASTPSNGTADPDNQTLVALAQQFGKASQATVVVGSAAASGSGSGIEAVRSSSAAGQVSTVDDADTVGGQVVAVQALEQQVTGHKPASYGTQSDAGAIAPSPAPTPSANSSSSSSATRAKTASGRGTKR